VVRPIPLALYAEYPKEVDQGGLACCCIPDTA
jgi:hypothetical protein